MLFTAASLALLLSVTAANAQRPAPKPPINPVAQSIEAMLGAGLCQFARYSVPPGKQAGKCPPRPEPRRR